ncbi:adenylate/guanylate cyclase domain-containing protein [Kiloniella majae]|uniref:adenylate/guanylate cyclase domain-containing protein n=1 Tax=Kiloniella majae TaxID=1938558 RepID=UPI000A2783F2|nr:adenylate/guanylate cyclase domain-containing protein [Kiloniella majae]
MVDITNKHVTNEISPGPNGVSPKPNEISPRVDCDIKKHWRPSIAMALSFGFGSMTMIALAIVIWLSFDTARDNTFALTREVTEVTFGSIRSHLDNNLNAAASQVVYMSDLVEQGLLDPDDEQSITQTIKGALAATPQVSGMILMKKDGSSVRAGWTDETSFVSRNEKGDNEYRFAALLQDIGKTEGVYWGGVVWIEEFKEPHISVFHPVYQGDQYIGAIGAIISISSLSDYFNKLDEETGNHTYLLLDRNKVLAHPSLIDMSRSGLSAENPLPTLNQVIDGNLRRIWNKPLYDFTEILGNGDIKGHAVDSFAGELSFLHTSFSGYGFEDLTLGIYFMEGELEGYYERLYLTGIAALVIALITVAIIFFSGKFIAIPLQRLAETSQQVGQLDLVHTQRLPGSMFRELDTAATAYNSMLGGLKWFENYVPKKLVKQLMETNGEGIISEEREISVMFTDIVSFTPLSESMPATELAGLLNHHFDLLGAIIEQEGGTIDKYIGDSVMAFWGAPTQMDDHAKHACNAALRIEKALQEDNNRRKEMGLPAINIRIGIHSGLAVAGNIGAKGRVNYTLIGDTVNTAQRLESLAKDVLTKSSETAKTLISATTWNYIKNDSKMETTPKGFFALRGRETETEAYELKNPEV